MQENQLEQLLTAVSCGEVPVAEALDQLKNEPFETVGDFARLDLQRQARTGFPEVILGEGKTPEQVSQIFSRLLEHSSQVLATRVNAEMAAYVQERVPQLTYEPRARCLYIDRDPQRPHLEGVAVVTAGTSDVPVAEEAALTAELMGNHVERIYDVGVAGLHRLLSYVPQLREAHVVIVVAGMEGALASVVGGLLSCPIVAVPTSVGYGANFKGLAALLAMLNSCAGGISVVNIDNGFGAGVVAARINRLSGGRV